VQLCGEMQRSRRRKRRNGQGEAKCEQRVEPIYIEVARVRTIKTWCTTGNTYTPTACYKMHLFTVPLTENYLCF
jgi:hypothetical protein